MKLKKYKIEIHRSTITEYFVKAETKEEALELLYVGDVVEGETDVLHSECEEPVEVIE